MRSRGESAADETMTGRFLVERQRQRVDRGPLPVSAAKI